MAGRFTLAQVRAVRCGAVQTALALCLAPMLSTLLWADSSGAQADSNTGAPTSTINPAPPSVRRPDLELGRQGGAVAELQGVLKLLGFYLGDVNGIYDEATSLAVVRFQAAAKLPQTGRVATNTWNALFPLDTPSPAIATAPPAPTSPASAPQPPTPPAPQSAPAAPTARPAPAAPVTSQPAAPTPAAPQPTAAPTPAQPSAKPNPYPTLKLGEKGDAVVRLQRQLNKKGFLDGQPDGAFGPMTEAAVKAAQEALDLEVDGVVGPATWQALLK